MAHCLKRTDECSPNNSNTTCTHSKLLTEQLLKETMSELLKYVSTTICWWFIAPLALLIIQPSCIFKNSELIGATGQHQNQDASSLYLLTLKQVHYREGKNKADYFLWGSNTAILPSSEKHGWCGLLLLEEGDISGGRHWKKNGKGEATNLRGSCKPTAPGTAPAIFSSL